MGSGSKNISFANTARAVSASAPVGSSSGRKTYSFGATKEGFQRELDRLRAVFAIKRKLRDAAGVYLRQQWQRLGGHADVTEALVNASCTITWRCDDRLYCQSADGRSVGLAG